MWPLQDGAFIASVANKSLSFLPFVALLSRGQGWVSLNCSVPLLGSTKSSSSGEQVETGATLLHSEEVLMLSSVAILGKFLISVAQLPHCKMGLTTELPQSGDVD